MRYRDKWPIYAKQINAMKIRPARVAEIKRYAIYAIQHKDTYKRVEAATGYPWYGVAVIHRREGDGRFNTYLGNGQLLSRRTTIKPRGRGPFRPPDAFLKGAKDALHLDGLDKVVPPWPIEKILYWSEILNGLGYEMHGLPSPYVWGGTTIQRRGKYIRDGVFSRGTWDTQPGVAAILWMIGYLDTSVKFTRET